MKVTVLFEDYTKSKTEFLDQLTRKCMVEWATTSLRQPLVLSDDPTVRYAVYKKWLTNRGGGSFSITTPGYNTATAFLKR